MPAGKLSTVSGKRKSVTNFIQGNTSWQVTIKNDGQLPAVPKVFLASYQLLMIYWLSLRLIKIMNTLKAVIPPLKAGKGISTVKEWHISIKR